MKLANLLNEQRVFLNLRAETCHEAMEELVGHLADEGVLQNGMRDLALRSLQCREAEVSTGVGCGVAIPHAYLPGLAQPVAIFGRSDIGVDFSACDHAPVHFVVMLLIPDDKRGQHLLTLADIAKRFQSSETRKALAEAKERGEALSIFAQ